jgi:two-component system response regulator HydG
LAAHFIKELNAQHGKHVTSIAEPVRRAIAAYDWPGNVRELRNFIESMVVLDTDGVLDLDDVQDSAVIKRAPPADGRATGPAHLVGRPLTEVERYYIEQALALTEGNREEAAKMLGIGERTLYRVIQEWKLQDKIRKALDEAHHDVAVAAKALNMKEAVLERKIKKWGWNEKES